MNDILKKYKSLKTSKQKRLFCLELDKKNEYTQLLSYEKLSDFSINVCFQKITNIKILKEREKRAIKYKEERSF
jgi:hypothetical protein